MLKFNIPEAYCRTTNQSLHVKTLDLLYKIEPTDVSTEKISKIIITKGFKMFTFSVSYNIKLANAKNALSCLQGSHTAIVVAGGMGGHNGPIGSVEILPLSKTLSSDG